MRKHKLSEIWEHIETINGEMGEVRDSMGKIEIKIGKMEGTLGMMKWFAGITMVSWLGIAAAILKMVWGI